MKPFLDYKPPTPYSLAWAEAKASNSGRELVVVVEVVTHRGTLIEYDAVTPTDMLQFYPSSRIISTWGHGILIARPA